MRLRRGMVDPPRLSGTLLLQRMAGRPPKVYCCGVWGVDPLPLYMELLRRGRVDPLPLYMELLRRPG